MLYWIMYKYEARNSFCTIQNIISEFAQKTRCFSEFLESYLEFLMLFVRCFQNILIPFERDVFRFADKNISNFSQIRRYEKELRLEYLKAFIIPLKVFA